MKKYFFVVLSCIVLCICAVSVNAQMTTSGITGRVISSGEKLTGATVILVHEPTGAQYGTITNESGIYNLPNLNPGGPYVLTVSFIGYNQYVKKDVYLTLGQTLQFNVKLSESAMNIDEVQVVAVASGVFDGNTTGSKTTVSRERIESLPAISRGISDFAMLTPQAKINSDGGVEIAGQNSKYNSFTIDGAVQNDVFGLASSGTNGGQIGINPMSMDIIDQLTISLSPYDVTQSGFAGAGINAVTKSGTNKFNGSAYGYYRNESLAGKTPTDNPEVKREKMDEFTAKTYGLTLAGPLVKNKLFFFGNVEIQRDETPKPFDFADYTGSASQQDLISLENKLVNDYGYNPGSYENTKSTLESEKVFLKLDWNISQKHKFSIRHQYSNGVSISPSTSSKSSIYFSNSGKDFSSKTNSTTAELKSIFSSKVANKLRLVYTNVDDNRDPMGGRFPYIYLAEEKINLGSEQYSTANRLKQKVLSFTDNLNIYSGKHSFTLGMHHEYYDMFNVFIRQNYGYYSYADLATFMADPNNYDSFRRSFSAVDDVTGDGTKGAAEFKVLQLGFYVQDDYQVNDNFKLTYGVRMDLPMYLDDPRENLDFNNSVIPYLEDTYGVDLKGAKTGKMPKTSALFSPRVGFNWDVNGDKTMQVRGGAGLFTSRIPYVWPGGSYNNNGMTIGGISDYSQAYSFSGKWNNQPKIEGAPSGQIDIFAEDFKMPQVFRANLALDKKLPYGINSTFDITYTKNVNNVAYQNLLVNNSGKKLTGTGDDRIIWENIQNDVNNNSGAEGKYTGIYLGYNTSKGHSFNFSTMFDKKWNNGLFASVGYNYGIAKAMNDGQSSQNSSQWRVPNQNGRNNLKLGYSAYDLGHRIMANVSYKFDYCSFTNSTITLFYNGQSGSRYSFGYNNGVSRYAGPAGGEVDGKNLTLMYVPEDQNDIVLVDDGDYTAQAQWNDLNSFINDHKYLDEHRGEIVDRNSQRMPFEHTLDLKFMQEFRFKVAANRENKIQITFDVFNFTNMLNKDWGRMHYSIGDYGVYQVLKFQGYQADGTTPTYSYYNKNGNKTYGIDDSGFKSSRWQAQIGVRYIF
ncbi:TonB-dependent receptor [Plebeiibacterium marinum]|uniref:Carboxypeptidase regulatory-like domain-containing protein n=1 Tax=Plebeiibacterium marinum TaxID=2992111 RepID=A0AAE3MDD9_9BACT|nr:carboxypeptidase regulatory-like domain-containing protein [Plebeiobacterium marinum]MCW3805654.1 carboxypeptidase regulatory-like domain-containing protein [Plebeiobacterium marinum]